MSVSLTPLKKIHSRISPTIFAKNLKPPYWDTQGSRKTDSWKKLEAEDLLSVFIQKSNNILQNNSKLYKLVYCDCKCPLLNKLIVMKKTLFVMLCWSVSRWSAERTFIREDIFSTELHFQCFFLMAKFWRETTLVHWLLPMLSVGNVCTLVWNDFNNLLARNQNWKI